MITMASAWQAKPRPKTMCLCYSIKCFHKRLNDYVYPPSFSQWHLDQGNGFENVLLKFVVFVSFAEVRHMHCFSGVVGSVNNMYCQVFAFSCIL